MSQHKLSSFFTDQSGQRSMCNEKDSSVSGIENGESSVDDVLTLSYSDGETQLSDSVDVQEPLTKCRKTGKRIRKFVMSWLDEYKEWLQKSSNGLPVCKVCPATLKPKKDHLEKHAQTEKHKRAMENYRQLDDIRPITSTIQVTTSNNATKKIELKIATFIAEHCSILTVDHLSELISSLFPDNKTAQNIKLHRTKCSRLIDSVLQPCLRWELLQDIGDSPYSLLLDESTDISTLKMLCLVIRYFSHKHFTMETTFYRMICLDGSDSDTITAAILTCLNEDGLDFKRLIGIGTDNAAVMVGQWNSVFTKLREYQPELFLVRCVCHSLALAASKAMDALPTTLDFLVEQTYAWFARSNKRQMEFAVIFETINGQMPLKILKHSTTRWLSRYQCVSRILEQWNELRLYFQSSISTERSFTVNQLAQMYNDDVNKIYLTLLASNLKLVTEMNAKFQADNANPLKLIDQLVNCYECILQKIVVPTHFKRLKPSTLRDYEFSRYLRDPLNIDISWDTNQVFGQAQISQEVRGLILRRCQHFLVELANQIRSRLPDSLDVLDLLRYLDPVSAMTAEPSSIRPLLRAFPDLDIDKESAALEYGLLHKGDWNQTALADPVSFWIEVHQKEGNSDGRFKNISKFALSALSMPLSNAAVERVFSTMNVVKTKLRNRMQLRMLDGILCVRYGLKLRRESCMNFTVTREMLEKFNLNMYEDERQELNEEETNFFNLLENYA